jgi:hypothetical protein
VGVVVAPLPAPDLIAHEQHRSANRKEVECEKVLYLLYAKPFYIGIIGRPFGATVPADIVVGSVLIVVSVALVVLRVVGDEVIQGESVVACNEVDALPGGTATSPIYVRAANNALVRFPCRICIALEEAAHIVAKDAVPLFPLVLCEATYLVEAAGIPGPCDQLGASKHRI